MIRAYLYKLIRSPLFYIGIVGVVGVCFLRLTPNAYKGIDVQTEMELLRGLDGSRKLFVIMSALPFAANFSDEWNSMAITNCIARKSVRKYAVTNVVMCYIVSLVTVFAGMMIFAGIYSTFYPLYYNPYGNDPYSAYAVLTEYGLPMLDLAACNFVFAASCAMWSVMGLTLSAFFPSKYIAVCAPFVFCYAVERMTTTLPIAFDLKSLSLSNLNWGAAPTFLYTNAVFLAISAVCGVIFTITAERRVRNGLN